MTESKDPAAGPTEAERAAAAKAAAAAAAAAAPAAADPERSRKWGGLSGPRQTRNNAIGGLVVAAILVLGLAAVVALSAPEPNKGFADGAAVLAMVSIVALGIERVIEGFWTVIAMFRSSWWPLTEIAKAVDSQVDAVNVSVKPVFDAALAPLEAAKTALEQAQQSTDEITKKIQAIRDQEDAFLTQVTRINSLARDNQRVTLVATAAVQAVNRVDILYGEVQPAVRQAFNDATQIATGAVDFVAGFKDNPAKKLWSLGLGALLGLVVAWFVGLDLFAAAGAPLASGSLKVGVALTGLVLGLGSNPTHQVVNYVTDVAKARKVAAIGVPDVSATGDAAAPPVPGAPQAATVPGDPLTVALESLRRAGLPLDQATAAGIRAELDARHGPGRAPLEATLDMLNDRGVQFDESVITDIGEAVARGGAGTPRSAPRLRPVSLNLQR